MSEREAILEEEVKVLREKIEKLESFLLFLKKDKFGSKSEKVQDLPPDQIQLFNEIEQEAKNPPIETETITYERKKGKQKKKPFPEHIDREEVIIDLPESEKFCPHDGTRLIEIGQETSEKLETIPARMKVITEKKKKYACPCCEKHVVQAKSNSILPGTIATPELLSFIIFSKFFQSLTLYRLEELFKLNGIDLKRGTMARWLVDVTKKLIPIWNILQDKVIDCGYMAIDATKVQVLKEKGRRAESKSSMWVRGSPELGIVLFDYDVSGGGAVAKRLVTGFSGALQADAHRGYNILDRAYILKLGCMMHSRRKFYYAWLSGEKKPGIAADALKMFHFIYDKEDSYKEAGLTPNERYSMRLKEIGPSLDQIKKWCELQFRKVLPSSPIGIALHYFISEYEELTAFLKDGRYEIDNGWVERQIKRFAIGRKNWLFSDTVEGAEASSILYSLTLTAKLNGKDPFEVMTKILKNLPNAQTPEDYEELAQMLLSELNPNSCRKKEGALIKNKRRRNNNLIQPAS